MIKIPRLFKLSKTRNPEVGVSANSHVTNLVVPEGGWVPMGHTLEGSYVVLSLKTGQLVTLRANDLRIDKLRVWLGREACKASTVYDTELQEEVENGQALTEARTPNYSAKSPDSCSKPRLPAKPRSLRSSLTSARRCMLTASQWQTSTGLRGVRHAPRGLPLRRSTGTRQPARHGRAGARCRVGCRLRSPPGSEGKIS